MKNQHQPSLPVLSALVGADRAMASQVIRADPWTAELASGNPALFFLTIRAARASGQDPVDVARLARLSRTELLERIGLEPSSSAERFLRKVAFWELTVEGEMALRAMIEKTLPVWARHCRRPHLALMTQIPFSRWESASKVFDSILENDSRARRRTGDMLTPAELNGYWGKPYIREVVEEIVETLRLIDYGTVWQRADAQQETARAGQLHILERCRTLTDIQQVHQQVINANSARWVELLPVNLKKKAWPAPPLQGNDHIEPVNSIDGLYWEGQMMRHCIATYAERVLTGLGFVYRVTHPERATLYVERDSSGSWFVKELRLSCNRAVSGETVSTVSRWLAHTSCRVAPAE